MEAITERVGVVVNNFDDEKRIISFTFSTNGVDRKGDTVNNNKWILDDFLKNPVFLWQHDIKEQPLGKIITLGLDANGNLAGDVEFWYSKRDPLLWSEFDKRADSVYEQYKAGYMRGASVRFMPTKIANGNNSTGGIDYGEQYLLEISAVSVPDNANALSKLKTNKKDNEKDYVNMGRSIANLIKI